MKLLAVSITCLALTGGDDRPSPVEDGAEVHWSFRPIRRPELPPVAGATTTDIDRFILQKLEQRGWTLQAEADRRTLARRVAFDLTGLPPTLAEIDAFEKDLSADAYERMVDRYLASPRYGERWGKYWLDAAGYADSNGYFNADTDRPHAWRYRDYVIDSFNADHPYDRFVTEQLAGDELAGITPDGDLAPEQARLLIATHFLRNSPDGTGESDGNPDELRVDRFTVLEGTVQIIGNCLLGLTLQCARCHEHKFEPIEHHEYYGLQAVFFPVYNPDRWTKPNERTLTVGTKVEREDWRRQSQRIDQQIKTLQDSLSALSSSLKDQLIEERLADQSADVRTQVLAALALKEDKRSAAQKELLKKHEKTLAVSDDDLARRFPEWQKLREQTSRSITEREKDRPKPQEIIAGFFETDPNPPAHHLLKRGSHNSPGEEVSPGVLSAVGGDGNDYRLERRPEGRISSGRRLALARWLTAPENPLFARVIVNRIWQRHFGVGIVSTPDNLGQSGSPPTHPELLDYLADHLRRDGFRLKATHRRIMRSMTYRQSSRAPAVAAKDDPQNRLLARYPLRRLDAEAIRDASLFASGELDLAMRGPYIPTKRGGDGIVVEPDDQPGRRRRSVYLQQRRTQVLTLLELFDAPRMVATCGSRTTSTVALQSLALVNSSFARGRAAQFAARLARESGSSTDARLERAFQVACGRSPLAEERDAAATLLKELKELYAGKPDEETRSWADLCQMILASNAFLYVE